jgi:hypothetical protein
VGVAVWVGVRVTVGEMVSVGVGVVVWVGVRVIVGEIVSVGVGVVVWVGVRVAVGKMVSVGVEVSAGERRLPAEKESPLGCETGAIALPTPTEVNEREGKSRAANTNPTHVKKMRIFLDKEHSAKKDAPATAANARCASLECSAAGRFGRGGEG